MKTAYAFIREDMTTSPNEVQWGLGETRTFQGTYALNDRLFADYCGLTPGDAVKVGRGALLCEIKVSEPVLDRTENADTWTITPQRIVFVKDELHLLACDMGEGLLPLYEEYSTPEYSIDVNMLAEAIETKRAWLRGGQSSEELNRNRQLMSQDSHLRESVVVSNILKAMKAVLDEDPVESVARTSSFCVQILEEAASHVGLRLLRASIARAVKSERERIQVPASKHAEWDEIWSQGVNAAMAAGWQSVWGAASKHAQFASKVAARDPATDVYRKMINERLMPILEQPNPYVISLPKAEAPDGTVCKA